MCGDLPRRQALLQQFLPKLLSPRRIAPSGGARFTRKRVECRFVPADEDPGEPIAHCPMRTLRPSGGRTPTRHGPYRDSNGLLVDAVNGRSRFPAHNSLGCATD